MAKLWMKYEDIKADFQWANHPLLYGDRRLTLHLNKIK